MCLIKAIYLKTVNNLLVLKIAAQRANLIVLHKCVLQV